MARKQIHELADAGAVAAGNYLPLSQSSLTKRLLMSALSTFVHTTDTYDLYLPCGDQTTAIAAGVGKLTFVVQRAMTLTGIAASLQTGGAGAVTTFDVNKNGTSLMAATKLTIDASETSSATAAAAAVLTTTALAAGDIITVDFDTVGTGGIGPVVYLLGRLG